jgi:hypothetical protein
MLKNPPFTQFDKLRANEAGTEIAGDCPFVLSLERVEGSKHEFDFFSNLLIRVVIDAF